MILAHRIELDPREKQKEYFRQACGTVRWVWNWALAEWNDRYDLGANTDASETLLNGSVLTLRDPSYASSKTCSQCGYVREVLPLSVREWTCPACQTRHHRDVNAAINLKENTVGYTGINAWGQEGSGLAGTASETGLVEPGTLQWVNTHFHSQER